MLITFIKQTARVDNKMKRKQAHTDIPSVLVGIGTNKLPANGIDLRSDQPAVLFAYSGRLLKKVVTSPAIEGRLQVEHHETCRDKTVFKMSKSIGTIQRSHLTRSVVQGELDTLLLKEWLENEADPDIEAPTLAMFFKNFTYMQGKEAKTGPTNPTWMPSVIDPFGTQGIKVFATAVGVTVGPTLDSLIAEKEAERRKVIEAERDSFYAKDEFAGMF